MKNNPEHEAVFIAECAKRGVTFDDVGRVDIGAGNVGPLLMYAYMHTAEGVFCNLAVDDAFRATRKHFGEPEAWTEAPISRELLASVWPFGPAPNGRAADE